MPKGGYDNTKHRMRRKSDNDKEINFIGNIVFTIVFWPLVLIILLLKLLLGKKGKSSKRKGCYIATAVYGSYDCPEVWTLRRYRDNYLAKHMWGRMFVRTYYFFSPTFVSLFSKKEWFNKLFRKKLDSTVSRLNDQGFSSEKYEDLEW